MLHSTLPRAFVTPGLKYLSGYYGEDVGSYPVPSSYSAPFEDHYYPRIPNDHHVFPTWHSVQRPASPCPLDLSLKPSKSDSIVNVDEPKPPERYEVNEDEDEEAPRYHLQTSSLAQSPPGYNQLLLTPQHQHQHQHHLHAPMTPPSTPSPPQCPRKRAREETPVTKTEKEKEKVARTKKKHARRLKFDEDTSSPVSGTVILGPDEAVVTGDIDPAFNVVEVTEEARAELAKIENRLGPYQCRLCRQLHEDAFQLAQHRCSRIAHVEYRCPECDKRFSCPANLASHRRWHKPRVAPGDSSPAAPSATNDFECSRCDAKFSRQAALRKHLASQHPEPVSNGRTSTGSTASCSSHLAISPVTVDTMPWHQFPARPLPRRPGPYWRFGLDLMWARRFTGASWVQNQNEQVVNYWG